MTRVKPGSQDGGIEFIQWNCPATGDWFLIVVKAPASYTRPAWEWNGDVENPTLTPSVSRKTFERDGVTVKTINHFFVTDGNVQFLEDCTHDKKGQTLPLQEYQE